MLRSTLVGLVALALFVLSNGNAPAGSIHSPITKAEAKDARIRLYEHEMTLRDANPTAFDHSRPVLGSVLASEAGLGHFLATTPFHHGLLCPHDPFRWRVVEGDILYHKLFPFSNSPPSPLIGPSLPTDSRPGGSTPEQGPPGGGPGDPGPSIQISSVPEPSSWLLMASGVILALYAATRGRKVAVIGPPVCPSPR
jgi:hypothetical protein